MAKLRLNQKLTLLILSSITRNYLRIAINFLEMPETFWHMPETISDHIQKLSNNS